MNQLNLGNLDRSIQVLQLDQNRVTENGAARLAQSIRDGAYNDLQELHLRNTLQATNISSLCATNPAIRNVRPHVNHFSASSSSSSTSSSSSSSEGGDNTASIEDEPIQNIHGKSNNSRNFHLVLKEVLKNKIFYLPLPRNILWRLEISPALPWPPSHALLQLICTE